LKISDDDFKNEKKIFYSFLYYCSGNLIKYFAQNAGLGQSTNFLEVPVTDVI